MAASSTAALAAMKSWVEYSDDSHFPIQNIPFGVFKRADGPQVCGTRIGDFVSARRMHWKRANGPWGAGGAGFLESPRLVSVLPPLNRRRSTSPL